MSDSGVRLTELLMALSLATDLGFGQPTEHMLRSARISMRLGERLGLGADDLATLYDVSLLTYVGCPVYGNEAATVFGDTLGRIVDDPRHSSEENRFVLLGLSKDARLLAVMFVERTPAIRIVSARRATRRERRDYEETIE